MHKQRLKLGLQSRVEKQGRLFFDDFTVGVIMIKLALIKFCVYWSVYRLLINWLIFSG